MQMTQQVKHTGDMSIPVYTTLREVHSIHCPDVLDEIFLVLSATDKKKENEVVKM